MAGLTAPKVDGVIISNLREPDVGRWNWLIGDGISSGLAAFRDFQDPTRYDQPKHMSRYVRTSQDSGGVHINSGIHNYAAYKIMTTKGLQGPLFKPAELAAMFYVALTRDLVQAIHFRQQPQCRHQRNAVPVQELAPGATRCTRRCSGERLQTAGIT